MSLAKVDYTGERGLSGRQRRILNFLHDYYRREGFPPSIREIGEHCGLSSTSSVHYQLQVLANLGKIRLVPGQSRAIDVRPSLDGGYGSRQVVAA